MNNIREFCAADFGNFLLESNLVGRGKEKFMVLWARKFFVFRTSVPNMSWPEQLLRYIKDLSDTGTFQDWQIRQAEQAVRLYFTNFLKESSSVSTQVYNPTTKIITQNDALVCFREGLRLRHYSIRTEKSYLGWVRRYFEYCQKRPSPVDEDIICTPVFVRDYLAYLAVKRNVSASTQNLAFNSLLMFYRLVFNKDIGDLKHAVRAKTRQTLPVVFSVEETGRLLSITEGIPGLMLKIIYGGGLRFNEC